MAASPAIDLREPLAALFKRAGVADILYRRYEGRLAELGVGDAGDLLEEVAEKGIGSLDIHDRQAEKLRRALLGLRGWGDAAAVLASLSGLSLGDTPAGVAAGDQAAGGGAAAGGAGRGGARPEEADGGACDAQAAEGGSGGGTEGSSLDPLEPALPEGGDGTIAAEGGEEEVEGGRKAPRRLPPALDLLLPPLGGDRPIAALRQRGLQGVQTGSLGPTSGPTFSGLRVAGTAVRLFGARAAAARAASRCPATSRLIASRHPSRGVAQRQAAEGCQDRSCVPPAPQAEKSSAELLRLAVVDVERADALLSDLLEEVAGIANAQLREPPLIPAVEDVGDARALEQSRERLSQVDGGRSRHRRPGARPRGPRAAGGCSLWRPPRGQRAAAGRRRRGKK